MNSRKFLPAVAYALALAFCAATTAQADTINVTYSLTGSGSGDPLNPPLIGNATGTLSPFGNITWSDEVFPHVGPPRTSTGTFKMTFADGDTLFGTLLYVPDISQFPIVPIAQYLTVTGGTGAFFSYHGTLTGVELSNRTNATFTSSGSGTITTTPEPGSLVLLATGLASLLVYQSGRSYCVRGRQSGS